MRIMASEYAIMVLERWGQLGENWNDKETNESPQMSLTDYITRIQRASAAAVRSQLMGPLPAVRVHV